MKHDKQHLIQGSIKNKILTNYNENKETSWYKSVGQGFIFPSEVDSKFLYYMLYELKRIRWKSFFEFELDLSQEFQCKMSFKKMIQLLILNTTKFPSDFIIVFCYRMMIFTWIILHFLVCKEVFLKSQAGFTIFGNTIFKEIINLFVRKPRIWYVN